MLPYTSFTYFGILAYLSIPTIAIGLIGKKRLSQLWLVVALAIMLLIQYLFPQKFFGNGLIEVVWLVIGYGIFEWAVAYTLLLLRKKEKNKTSQLGFYLAIACAVVPLMAVKAAPIFRTASPVAFIGISYVTFRVVDVIINIYDGLITQLPIVRFLSFILFFPTISSGPIDNYRRFSEDFTHERTRQEFINDLNGAVHRIFKGFFYEFIAAALIKTYWLDPAGHNSSFLGIVSYMYAYSFYLFFDFAGYSAFAISISYLFGIHTPENFNWAFFSRNIKDFWNRWHMSLSFWFRDHIYSRFVFAAMKGKWLDDKYAISYLGYLVTFGLMGFWHGFTWYFVIYGFYHAFLLIGYDIFSRSRRQSAAPDKLGRNVRLTLSIFLTFNLVCFGFLIFSGRLDPSFKPAKAPVDLGPTTAH